MKKLVKKPKPQSGNSDNYKVRKALDLAKVNLENLPETHADDHMIATYVCDFRMKVFNPNVPLIVSKKGYVMLSMLQKKNHPEIFSIKGPKKI